MKLANWTTICILILSGGDALARAGDRVSHGSSTASSSSVQSGTTDTVRLPYSPGKVYQVRLEPGAPFALELPAGESAKNLWYDNHWWAAETTPGASRVFIRALPSDDVVGRSGFIHIETEPSDLRVSLRVSAVRETASLPAALELYLEGSVLNDPSQRQLRRSFDRDLVYAQKQAEERAHTEFESWRKNAVANLRGDEAYERGGDFRITRAVDDRVQTFVSIPNATDRAVIQFVDKTGRAELVNYELENGTYVIQNKVLRPGEKFRLVLGKEQGWVGLK
jgi:Conjugal transfer protein